MKKTIVLILLITVFCSKNKELKQIVEISCGQCQLGIQTPKGCDLAVRINQKTFFVDGASIDDFGDAHDKESGFCNAIRKANVTGIIKENRFIASSIELLPKEK